MRWTENGWVAEEGPLTRSQRATKATNRLLFYLYSNAFNTTNAILVLLIEGKEVATYTTFLILCVCLDVLVYHARQKWRVELKSYKSSITDSPVYLSLMALPIVLLCGLTAFIMAPTFTQIDLVKEIAGEVFPILERFDSTLTGPQHFWLLCCCFTYFLMQPFVAVKAAFLSIDAESGVKPSLESKALFIFPILALLFFAVLLWGIEVEFLNGTISLDFVDQSRLVRPYIWFTLAAPTLLGLFSMCIMIRQIFIWSDHQLEDPKRANEGSI